MKPVETTITLDEAGRVALPKGVREALHLSPGDTLEVAVEGDKLSLRPHGKKISRLEQERGVWVLRTGEPLSQDEAKRALESVRAER